MQENTLDFSTLEPYQLDQCVTEILDAIDTITSATTPTVDLDVQLSATQRVRLRISRVVARNPMLIDNVRHQRQQMTIAREASSHLQLELMQGGLGVHAPAFKAAIAQKQQAFREAVAGLREELARLCVGMLLGSQSRARVPGPGRATEDGPMSILYLASNPIGTDQIRLDAEAREIEERIRLGITRNAMRLVTKLAVRPRDLLDYLTLHRPGVIHFSGHGDSRGFILEAQDGSPQPLSQEALAGMFAPGVLDFQVRLVVFNACYSHELAEAVAEHVDCVVGVKDEILDRDALVFSSGFYGALAHGLSVQRAFNQANIALHFEDGRALTRLHHRPDVDPDQIFLHVAR